MKSCGIIGLPNVGKSTLFKVLSGNFSVSAENYPFCTIDPNVGVAIFKDRRLEELACLSRSKKVVYQTVAFTDIAGLVEGASKGFGLGNKFLDAIKNVKALLHVVRCFEDPKVVHVCGSVSLVRDIRIVENELMLSDMQNAENIIQKMKKIAKTDESTREKILVLQKFIELLSTGKKPNINEMHEDDTTILNSYQFLTLKPVVYVANMNEECVSSDTMKDQIRSKINEFSKDASIVFVSSKLEMELALLCNDDRDELLKEYGLNGSCLDKIMKSAMCALGYQTFFTIGPKEAHAWNIKIGGTAVNAASEIHTDLANKFVKAEIIQYNNMIKYQTRINVKKQGFLHTEGALYLMQDGDIINVLASS